MMHMTFYWGKDVTILFDFWRVKTWTWYAVSLLVVFVFSALHEWLASQRSALSAKVEKGAESLVGGSEEDGEHRTPLISHAYPGKKSTSKKVMEAFLFGINVGLGYMLMLAAMSFNGGVFLAIVVGLAVGNFLFRSEGSPSDSACGAM
ncbi:hypothetical protein M758_3G133200 [Ceratodon purpureus]|uniref:Copper transport protein n=1 Tax=Ceratodon purpureus TaxID=3225 RepID=A0A8T0IKI8_CERPU|nr:hypothetical protein KC19_3G131500 [Ceratodon purpureus]KAG0622912.1 hypothetical protein M758_3G133200 [Ceratodon purpureus]